MAFHSMSERDYSVFVSVDVLTPPVRIITRSLKPHNCNEGQRKVIAHQLNSSIYKYECYYGCLLIFVFIRKV
jgi:hypothetical protein